MPTYTSRQFATDLERKILVGLSREWEAAIGLLDEKHRRLMKIPLFRLLKRKRLWGSWNPNYKEISISRKLAFDYPWDSVREVLHHEMAHQLTDQLIIDPGETSHGPTFLEACRLLRANPKASGTYLPLKDRCANNRISENDRILIRIRKLMALSESRNRHEAEAAMLKAHTLMAKYNIDLINQDKYRNFVSVFAGRPALRHTRDAYYLSSLLVDFYFVQGIWVSAWVAEREKMGRVLEITGTLENIVTAKYVYDFVKNHINAQWQHYNRRKQLTLHRKTDFAAGILDGFRAKLNRQKAVSGNGQETGQVATIEDPLLLSHVKYRYPFTRSYRSTISNQDEQVLADGRKIGQKMVISRGITEASQSRQRLIE